MERKLFLTALGVFAWGMVANAAPTPVTMWMGSWWTDQAPVIVAEYAKVNPNVALTIEPLPINGYADKAVSTILGGNPPDIIDMDGTWLPGMIDKGLLQPWSAADLKGIDFSDYNSAILTMGKKDGTMYAMPNRAGASVFYYNKTMFDRAKVPYPKDSWVWADLRSMAKKITRADKQEYGLGMAASNSDPGNAVGFIYYMVWSWGGEVFSKDYKACLLSSPQAVAALTQWVEYYTKDKIVPEGTPNYTVSKDLVPLFMQNKVAMIIGPSTYIPTFEADKNLKWGVVAPPNQITNSGGWSFTVPVGATHTKEAKDFILWFSQPDVMGRLMIREPARVSAIASSPTFKGPNYQAVIKAGTLKGNRPAFAFPQLADFQTILLSELQKALQGVKTPKQAADEIVKQTNALLAKG